LAAQTPGPPGRKVKVEQPVLVILLAIAGRILLWILGL
jgi:hypothetical protein